MNHNDTERPRPILAVDIMRAANVGEPTFVLAMRSGSWDLVGHEDVTAVHAQVQQARLRAMCMGSVPTKRGNPSTTISRSISDIIASEATE